MEYRLVRLSYNSSLPGNDLEESTSEKDIQIDVTLDLSPENMNSKVREAHSQWR